jgi:hypothetical protein
VTADPIRAIADAVLYEGYILWPYRRSALKNQQRFQFGGVFPPAHTAVHPDDRSSAQTEVLVRGEAAATVEIGVRFLHVVKRQVARREGDRLLDVDELVLDGESHLTWEEACEREVIAPALTLAQLAGGHVQGFAVPAGSAVEQLTDRGGSRAGAVTRTWRALQGALELRAVALGADLWRVTARVSNTTPCAGASRRRALGQTLCSTHTLLRVDNGPRPPAAFVSLTDPPAELAPAAQACVNVGMWPVLVGEPGDARTMLSSPIILEDHPRIAPESPGDLFDGGEIDQLLILNILTLTDAEKAEMAASDPRAREILDRCEALTPDQLMALHGTVREFGLAR